MSESKTPDVTPLDGVTKIDEKTTFEPERLSYVAAGEIARQIAALVASDIGGRAVVIANEALLADLANLSSAGAQLGTLAQEYRQVAASSGAPDPFERLGAGVTLESLTNDGTKVFFAFNPLTAAAGLSTGLKAAIGLFSLLRQDVDYRGAATKVDRLAFEIAVAGALRAQGVARVLVPDLLVPVPSAVVAGSLTASWDLVEGAREAAWRAVGPFLAELAQLEAALDIAGRVGSDEDVERISRELLVLRRRVEPLTDALRQADKRFNEIQSQWNTVSETTGVTLFARLLRAEAIAAMEPLYLHAAVVASGGHTRITRNLFRMMFLGDGVSAMGGAVARWALLAPDGNVIQGGNLAARRSARFPSTFE